MKLLSVEGSNVGLLKGSFEFKFGGALTTITGPIGCGKSTLLTMIKASLTNSVPGSGASWVSWGTGDSVPSYFTSTWELNNQIIEITKPLADNTAFKTLSKPRVKVSSPEGETLQEVFTAREANELMAALLPVSTKVIDSHLIIDQDQITYPTSATPAKFQETIHVLTKVNQMEVARSKVRESLSSYTVPEVSEEVIRLKADKLLLEQEIGESNTRQSDIDNELQTLDSKAVAHDIAILQEAESNAEKRSTVEAELAALTNQKNVMEGRLNTSTEQLQDQLQKREEYADTVDNARKLLAKYEYLERDWQEKQSLEETCKLQQSELQSLVEPPKPEGQKPQEESVEELKKQKAMLSVKAASNETKIALAEAGKCHTCGQPTDGIDKQALIQESEELGSYLKQVSDLQTQVENKIKEFEAFSLAEDMHTLEKSRISEALQETKTRLSAVAAAQEVSPDYKEEWTKVVGWFDALELNIKTLESNIADCRTKIEVYGSGIANAHSNIEMLGGSAKPDPVRLKVRLSQQEYINGLLEESLMLQGLVKAKAEELERVSVKLKALQVREESAEPIKNYREVLERAAEVLHKTGLPKVISTQYLSEINVKLQEYLEMVEASFSAWIDKDLQFMVKKSDGLVHRANRLSGGQKQQASISYLLAVNDVFASSLGVLAMDEPTGSMQEDNAKDVAEAFSKLLQIGKQTKRQFIVITHSETLASYGEVRIDLRSYL